MISKMSLQVFHNFVEKIFAFCFFIERFYGVLLTFLFVAYMTLYNEEFEQWYFYKYKKLSNGKNTFDLLSSSTLLKVYQRNSNGITFEWM